MKMPADIDGKFKMKIREYCMGQLSFTSIFFEKFFSEHCERLWGTLRCACIYLSVYIELTIFLILILQVQEK